MEEDAGMGYGGWGATHPATYKHYYTGSCTCAQDAWEAIMKAATDAVMDCIPLEEEAQRVLTPYITALEHCAVEWLSGLDCGCDDSHMIPLGPNVISSAVSTYQCCCDVKAVRDIIIHHIGEVKNGWMAGVDMHGILVGGVTNTICQYQRFDEILKRAEYALFQILEVYTGALFGHGNMPECELETGITPCP